jgi:hypothetical protein
VCLVELGRRVSTGVFVKLVMTDREGSPGGVRFAHAAESTDALKEVMSDPLSRCIAILSQSSSPHLESWLSLFLRMFGALLGCYVV